MSAAKTVTPGPARAPATPAQASLYQQLRGHLAELKLHDAAEALPAVLDQASTEGLTMTAALEQLLAIEVSASQARRLARPAPLRIPAIPGHPGGLRLRRRTRRRTPSSSPSWPPAATSRTPPTSCSSGHPASARPTSPSAWPAKPPKPATAPTSPPPPTSPPAATAPPSKDAGPPPCASSTAPACW